MKRSASCSPSSLPGPTGESQRAAPCRARTVGLHQSVEFPAGHLHRPGRGGAGRGQRGRRQAGGSDAADRLRRHPFIARGRRAGGRPAFPARQRQRRGRRVDRRPPGFRRCFHGIERNGHSIQRTLATRGGPIVPFIAETGGINAMIVDSSALLERAVADAIRSAFDSAGQRCSAARIVFVQADVRRRSRPC